MQHGSEPPELLRPPWVEKVFWSTERPCGKTPVPTADQARQLLDSIPLTKKDGSPDLAGMRDRALIGIMVYSFGRVSAVCGMQVGDYYHDGKAGGSACQRRAASNTRSPRTTTLRHT